MKRRLAVLGITLAMLAGVTAIAFAASSAGTESDPIVTQSYVDSKTSYETISLEAGQKLIGGLGTEIIVRSGEATAIDNGANGISDVTGGKDLMTGTQVELNHLLLTPRDDGRGIYAETIIWVMVRGEYTVK